MNRREIIASAAIVPFSAKTSVNGEPHKKKEQWRNSPLWTVRIQCEQLGDPSKCYERKFTATDSYLELFMAGRAPS